MDLAWHERLRIRFASLIVGRLLWKRYLRWYRSEIIALHEQGVDIERMLEQ